jgi:Helix-turn-helix domain
MMNNFHQYDQAKNNGVVETTTDPQPKTMKANFKDNSKFNQCLKMLDWLLERDSITTDQAREHLDIMLPAGTIKTLREYGYLIVTVWVTWVSELCIKHRVARYVLQRKEPLESVNNSEVAA